MMADAGLFKMMVLKITGFVLFIIFTKLGLHFYLTASIIELSILKSFALVS